MEHNIGESIAFLDALYGRAPSGYGTIWTLENKRSWWFDTAQSDWLEKALPVLEDAGKNGRNTYVGPSLSRTRGRANERIKATDSVGIGGLWLDLDYSDPAHRKPNLPPDADSALALVTSTLPQFPPTVTVNSGHGLQLWWLFDDFWSFTDGAERGAAAAAVRDWQQLVRAEARTRGWDVDATHDLARVMRLPGTVNRKTDPTTGEALPPVLATATYTGPTYARADLLAAIVPVDVPPAQPTTYTVGEIVIDADARPPFDRFDALYANVPKFRQSWERKRTDFGDQSASAYDLSIVHFCLHAGWTDQEAVDTAIAWRRKHGELDLAKVRRVKDYWAPLLVTAHTGRYGAEPARIPEIEDRIGRIDTAVSAEEVTDARALALAELSTRFKCQITDYYCLRQKEPEYWVVINGERYKVGPASKARTQNAWLDVFYQAKVPQFAPMKPATWAGVAELFSKVAEERGVGGTLYETAEAWVSNYLRTQTVVGSFAASRDAADPFYDQNGDIYLYLSSFHHWLATQPDRPTRPQLIEALYAYGAAYRPAYGGQVGATWVTARVWQLPRSAAAERTAVPDVFYEVL